MNVKIENLKKYIKDLNGRLEALDSLVEIDSNNYHECRLKIKNSCLDLGEDILKELEKL